MRSGADLANDYSGGVSLADGALTATHTGEAVDLQDTGPGVHCLIGGNALNSSADITIDVKIQTSPDNSTWSDLTGATMTQVASPATFFEKKSFYTRDARYARLVATLGGTSKDIDIVGILLGQTTSG